MQAAAAYSFPVHKLQLGTPHVRGPSSAPGGSSIAMEPNGRVVLVACGSFNPPTVMHTKMFELAAEALSKVGG